jgi:hypothetical protein
MKRIVLVLVLLMNFLLVINASADDILNAMRDEIKRSLNELRMENLQKPYYIEYTLTVQNSHNLKATLGAITEDESDKAAVLNVSVRVGSYDFDNTNFFDFGFSIFGSADDEENYRRRMVPVNLDYSSLRRELWLATDAAYKQSLEVYTKKEATLKNRMRKDTLYDFIQMPAEFNIDSTQIPQFDKVKFTELVKKASAMFLAYPQIQSSGVTLEYIPQTVYYVNSEGREYIKNELYTGYEVAAIGQSEDGMPLVDYYSAYSTNPEYLPANDSLIKAAEGVALKLSKILNAPVLSESYSGPILFEQQAAAELFAQIFAPNLVSQRQSLTESGMQDGGKFFAFQSKIGGRVLPEFMSVTDDPTIPAMGSTILTGKTNIDDQGVKAQRVELVKSGYLKSLLSSRVPTKRIKASNGHTRGGGTLFSSMFVTADISKALSNTELKKKMMQLCKDRELPFGIIVRKVMNQNILFTTMFRLSMGDIRAMRTDGKVGIIEAYKVYPDGREELLRGVEGNGFGTQNFKDIIFTSDKAYVLNLLAPSVQSSFITGGSQYVAASIVSPDLLFEDGEIKPVEDDFPKPPIIKSPLGQK